MPRTRSEGRALFTSSQSLNYPSEPNQAVLQHPHSQAPLFSISLPVSVHSSPFVFLCTCLGLCTVHERWKVQHRTRKVCLTCRSSQSSPLDPQILKPFQFLVPMSWNSAFLFMYFLRVVLKKPSMHQNTLPFTIPPHNVWNAAFSRTDRKSFPDLFYHMHSFEMFLLRWWRKQFYTWKLRVSLRQSQRAGVWKITAPDNMQQCSQEFWKAHLATWATVKGLSLNSWLK